MAALVACFGMAGTVQAANPLSPVQSWTQQTPDTSPPPRFGPSLTFDPASGNTVMFGGFLGSPLNDTWIWDGTDWTEVHPDNEPSPQNSASMAFDPNTGTVLLFGGLTNGGFSNETWSWDGSDWTQLNPATSPAGRAGASMAFDASTGEMVLFGGSSGSLRTDTWTWDGTNWTARTPGPNPPARQAAPMAFDPSTGDIVMFGGNGTGGTLDETWVWTGTSWVQKAPATKPPAQGGGGMAFDPLSGDLVLFGNVGSSPGTSESWSWDGSNWEAIESAADPLPVNGPGMSFDARNGNIVLFGGQAGASNNQTWTYGPPPGLNSAWFEQDPTNSPPGRLASGSTFDESTGTTVLYGGYDGNYLNQTWNWDGDDWSQAAPATSPPGMQFPDITFDPASGDALLLAGNTWSWSGTNWTSLLPPNSPSNREGSALAFDPSMGRLLLFGGFNGIVNFDQTWTWDGNTWTQLSPAHSPPGRSNANMAFDQSTGNMVLFGGSNFNDTWIWDGVDWTEANPATSPPGRGYSQMDYDPTTGDVVLYGGQGPGPTQLRDTWRWDGTNWTEETEPGDPSTRMGPAMSFSPRSGGMVLYGGFDIGAGQMLDETWTYELVAGPPSAEIASPADGGEYTLGESVPTSFTCDDDAGGPGIDTSLDSNGDTSPGELDTSTAGSRSYTVTATSENGQTGATEISYEVKAQPTLTVTDPSSGAFGSGPLEAYIVLDDGSQPTGIIDVQAYGPDDPTCSKTPAFGWRGAQVTGNGIYPTPPQAISSPGEYRWVAQYPGDTNNKPVETACGAPGSISSFSKVAPNLTPVSANVDNVSDLSFTVEMPGALNYDGKITFAAYGPDDPNCSGEPAFKTNPVELIDVTTSGLSSGPYRSPSFTATETGTYRWVARYEGSYVNEPASTECDAPNSVINQTVTCEPVKLGLRVKTFKPNPRAINRQVPGIRILLSSNQEKVGGYLNVDYRYRVGTKARKARVFSGAIIIGERRRALFGVPPKMAKQLRRATGHVSRNPVTVRITGHLLLTYEDFRCRQPIEPKTLKTRISGVNEKLAYRRLSSPWIASSW